MQHFDTSTWLNWLKRIDHVMGSFLLAIVVAFFKTLVRVALTSLLSDKFISELIVHLLNYLEPKATNTLEKELIAQLEQQLKHPDGSSNAPPIP